jgi:hypothetical protein
MAMNRYLAAAGLVVGIIIGAFAIAAVGAQEDSPTPTPAPSSDENDNSPKDRYKDRLAENLGITREELDDAITKTHLSLIDEAVEEGRITEDRADELRERVENGEPVFPGHAFKEHHGRGNGHGHGFGLFRGLKWLAGEASDILGLEEGELRQAYKDGKSLADLAEEKGISTDDLKSQILDAAKTKLDEKVADEDITQEEADAILERLTNNIDDIINFTPSAPPAEGEGFHFGPPLGGPGSFETEEAEIDA